MLKPFSYVSTSATDSFLYCVCTHVICACVRVRACVRARACVRVCVRVAAPQLDTMNIDEILDNDLYDDEGDLEYEEYDEDYEEDCKECDEEEDDEQKGELREDNDSGTGVWPGWGVAWPGPVCLTSRNKVRCTSHVSFHLYILVVFNYWTLLVSLNESCMLKYEPLAEKMSLCHFRTSKKRNFFR